MATQSISTRQPPACKMIWLAPPTSGSQVDADVSGELIIMHSTVNTGTLIGKVS